LERSEHLLRRKEIYEALHPETVKGVAGAHAANKSQGRKHASGKVTFASDTASKVKVSRSTVEKEVRIARSLTAGAKTSADSTSLLKNPLLLARRLNA